MMPIYLTAVILGILEGITEFLPVSSTGHLIVAERLLHFHDIQNLFTVIIQVGAIAAVVWFYRKDLLRKVIGLFHRERDALFFWKMIVIGTIPAGIIGLGLEKATDSLATPLVVAISLIIGGIILWLVDHRSTVIYKRDPEQVDFSELTTKRALLIGLGQSVSIIPGVSRSGATIVSGLATGLNRPTATAFSFYLSIPVLVLASALKIYKYSDKIHSLPGGLNSLLLATVIAFVVALMSISWLLRYVSRHDFRAFAYYRVGAGGLILLLLAMHKV
jgi:undecaprenyl-diphosphatase